MTTNSNFSLLANNNNRKKLRFFTAVLVLVFLITLAYAKNSGTENTTTFPSTNNIVQETNSFGEKLYNFLRPLYYIDPSRFESLDHQNPQKHIHDITNDQKLLFFSTTVLSFLAFTISYILLRSIIIPLILNILGNEAKTFFYKEIPKYEQTHHSQVFLSLVHAIIASYGSYQCTIGRYGLDLFQFATLAVLDEPYDKLEMDEKFFYLAITLGYFVADTLFYFCNHFHPLTPGHKTDYEAFKKKIFKHLKSLDFLHHSLSIIAYISLFMSNVGTFILIAFEFNEISTPFLHVRYYGKQWGKTNTLWYKLNQALFVGLFFLSRIVYNFFLICVCFWAICNLQTYASHQLHTQILVFIPCFMYYGVQLMWWYAIMNLIIRLVFKKQKIE
ncbi:hypothetical protein ABK040_001800 [Willaertia magna]